MDQALQMHERGVGERGTALESSNSGRVRACKGIEEAWVRHGRAWASMGEYCGRMRGGGVCSEEHRGCIGEAWEDMEEYELA